MRRGDQRKGVLDAESAEVVGFDVPHPMRVGRVAAVVAEARDQRRAVGDAFETGGAARMDGAEFRRQQAVQRSVGDYRAGAASDRDPAGGVESGAARNPRIVVA
jgi:hypothetical protein